MTASDPRRDGFDRDRHARIAERLASPSSVGQCLVYDSMLDVPPAFDRFADAHFRAHVDPRIAWPEICPAYALALLAYGSYRLPDDAAELRTLWDELASSRLDWREAEAVVADVWRRFDRDGPPAAD